jgi:hypothetical protein
MGDEPAALTFDGPTKPCKLCGLPIPAGAKYCTRCEKYQGFLDRLRVSASISGLVSLISVGTLAYGFLAGVIKNAEPQVVLTPVACSAQEVRLALSNLGDRPALFQGGTVSLEAANAPPSTRSLTGEDIPSLLPAQSNKITTLQVAALAAPHLPLPFDAATAQAPRCRMRLQLAWTDGHNRKHSDDQTCACGS